MKTRIALNQKATRIVALAAALLAAVSAGASAEPQNPGDALIAHAERAVQSARSFRASFEEIDTYPTNYKDLAQRGTITLARDGRLRIQVSRFRRVSSVDPWAASGNDILLDSDGATYNDAFLHPHSALVRQERSSTAKLAAALKLLPPAAAFFAPAGDVTLPGKSGPAVLEPPLTWEGARYQLVQYPAETRGGEASALAYIGKDGLVHRLIYTSQTPKGAVVKEWNLRHIALNSPIDGKEFAYKAPANSVLVGPGQRDAPLSAGAPAPDFTVLDSQGKPARLSDYRGKTVILDFWATWCWPCNQSLPHVESVAQAKRDNSVAVLAVAIWDSKAGFDQWIARHHYPDIRFAVDPRPEGQDIASTLYHVSTTPTAYVIGPDGKIVRAIAGYSGPTGELESAIEAASPIKAARAGR